MLVLYGRHYFSRYRVIDGLIPAEATVLDVCCGPAVLYRRYLVKKRVGYTGLDVNEGFIRKLRSSGASGKVRDLRSDAPLPIADYVIMQASLYHFLPNASPVVDRMLEAARKQVIIAEPIANIATSRVGLLSKLGRRFTDTGHGEEALRFTEDTLDEFFKRYSPLVNTSFLVPGGREKVYVLEK